MNSLVLYPLFVFVSPTLLSNPKIPWSLKLAEKSSVLAANFIFILLR